MDRRGFHRLALAAGLAMPAAAALGKIGELRITRVLLQRAQGRRLTPVAPNAFAAYRGYGAVDPVLRLQTAQGLEGIGCYWGPLEALAPLVGIDPFALLAWDGDRVRGVAEPHAPLLARLAGADVALFDLMGQALGRPITDLLGPRVRESVAVYDSSLYMEDLLTPEQREGLAYLEGGPPPQDPAEMVGRKAAWLMRRPGGIRIFKIKLGRVRWMGSFDEALARDIDVVRAVRRAMGDEITLLVDGNNGYRERPLAAAELALATAGENIHAMEEMFDEESTDAAREMKRRLRSAGLSVLLADGETHPGGIPAALLAERFTRSDGTQEPLYDIDQPDMNTTGYAGMLEAARDCARFGVALAPHNFGSKLGFWSQVHLGLVTPGWAFSEADDSDFPALHGDGFRLADGQVALTGMPGLGVRLEEAHLDAPLLDLSA